MSRTALYPFVLGLLSAAMACSAAEPSGREPLVPVEFHENGFSVGHVSYTGVCETTFYEQCQTNSDDCIARCGTFSGNLYVDCAEICWSTDCSSRGNLCADYAADFDFGPPNSALAAACNAWTAALETTCNTTRPEDYCERVATTWRPEFASVFDCSAEQTRRGVCSESCELPASSFGDELCLAMDSDPDGCEISAVGNLLGGVLRDDVIEAAYACLALDYTPYLNGCLSAWEADVVP